MLDFSIIAYKIIKRKRQRLNIITSGFFISLSIGFILNMVYYVMSDRLAILILNFLTNYFIFFGAVFLFIVNMIILESTLIYSVKRQNRYILLYGFLLFMGMLILVVFGEMYDNSTEPFLGVQIIKGAPKWGLIFFIYVIVIMSSFTIIPIIYTNFKIYFRFETKTLKRKWFCHLVGFLGLSVLFYLMCIYNLLDPEKDASFRSIISIFSISAIVWGYLMYKGIGTKLKS